MVLFAVNLFFAQRLVRAMHPSVGWHPVFSYFSLALIFSVPVVTVLNIIVISVSFFSAGQAERLHTAEKLLKLGSSWNMMLATMPLVWMFLASAVPGLPPENFGTGQFRPKATLLVFSAVTLAAGAAVRLAALLNPESPAAMSTLFSKPVFYGTQFLLELVTVAAYAAFRVDSLFHVPNGASGPGQYCAKKMGGGGEKGGGAKDKDDGTPLGTSALGQRDIERELERLGVRYEILRSGTIGEKGPLLALLHVDAADDEAPAPGLGEEGAAGAGGVGGPRRRSHQDGMLPPRDTTRVSRRQSLMDVLRPARPRRSSRATMYMTEDLPSRL